MMKLIIRWTTTRYEERLDTDTGETCKYPIYDQHVKSFNLDDVLLIDCKWNNIEVTTLEGEHVVIRGDNITQFFRQIFNQYT